MEERLSYALTLKTLYNDACRHPDPVSRDPVDPGSGSVLMIKGSWAGPWDSVLMQYAVISSLISSFLANRFYSGVTHQSQRLLSIGDCNA